MAALSHWKLYSPGLSSIQYRIGTFSSFRRAMLDAVTFVKVPEDTRVTPPFERPNPFAPRLHGSHAGMLTSLGQVRYCVPRTA